MKGLTFEQARLTDEQRELAESCIPMAHRIAGEYTSRLIRACVYHIDRDSILSDAFLGLIYAARGYDTAMGVKFATYAYTCISKKVRSSRALPNWSYTETGDWFAPSLSGFTHLRSESSHFDLADPPSREPAPDDALETRERVERLLGDLTPLQRDILLAPFTPREVDGQPLPPMNDKELAVKYCRNRDWVRRTRNEALAIVRARHQLQAA
ncbi:sigma-70 family RNA polymerase sigma factor [Gemmata sp. G18]|uniref:Sigma-70 family RNA polymerase sigma factor n=1 Tax=Gemmata palustris TaxID=2822762 RepID=A0ABS5BSR5_9BACT|nr:sigma-70 family RNA polymerase sigma factor [Gemmata palustris]MBP3956457.1 sigma-70 family RNA polymerase sigma factor [Gemmata palustris]